MLQRRDFLATTLASTLIAALQKTGLAQSGSEPLRILLRSSWQTVNIGDIAHTPGVLAIIEEHLPQAEVMLWASGDLGHDVGSMLTRRFPKLKIVKGTIKDDGRASNEELQQAIEWSTFLLHGSGPSLVAYSDVKQFHKHVGKPFGVYGITHGTRDPGQNELLSQARFVFFRETISYGFAKKHGVNSPVMGFGPDGAFACDLRNDEAATAFLSAHDLTPGKFLCCIPRLRYTPYWLIHEGRQVDAKKAARNEEMRTHDHAPLLEAICEVVRKTDHKVLVCPEDKTHMQVGKDNLIDKLPDDVKPRVVWRENYWLTDEALSTYLMSSGIFGLEMHSPIMCIGNGIPALVGRFEEQTTKGFMWRDIGLNDWLFDFDQPEETAKLTETVLGLINARPDALARVTQARQVVEQRQKETILEITRARV